MVTPVTMYKDSKNRLHDTEAEAINADKRYALLEQIEKECKEFGEYDENLIAEFVLKHCEAEIREKEGLLNTEKAIRKATCNFVKSKLLAISILMESLSDSSVSWKSKEDALNSLDGVLSEIASHVSEV